MTDKKSEHNMKISLLLSLAVAAAMFGSQSAYGVPITIYNTGTTASGVDPYYRITATTDPTISGNTNAYADTSSAGGWASAISGTHWISPSTTGNGTQSFGIYSYTYSTTFDLTGLDPATATLAGLLQADDVVTLLLNGNQVSGSNIGTYTRPTAFSIGSQYSADFLSGINTLSFVVNNSGNYATGFDASVSGTALSATPEVGSFAMISVAGMLLTGFGVVRKRLHQSLV
jgi:hypothetical protein